MRLQALNSSARTGGLRHPGGGRQALLRSLTRAAPAQLTRRPHRRLRHPALRSRRTHDDDDDSGASLLAELEAAFEEDDAAGLHNPPKKRSLSPPPLFDSLSDELLLHVLAHLAPEDLLAACRVSRRWHSAATDAVLWRRLYWARWTDGPTEDAEQNAGVRTWEAARQRPTARPLSHASSRRAT